MGSCFRPYKYSTVKVLAALTVSLAVGMGAAILGWLTPTASIAVSLMGFGIVVRLGWFWTLPAVLFLGVGSLLSRGREGRRNVRQVLANGGVATLFALLGDPGAYLTALATAFSDTVATEVGTRLSKRAYLITTFAEVPPGTSGGVSLPGTVAGILTALLMASFSLLSGEGNPYAVSLAASVGFLSDSIIGAVLESRSFFGNDTTNLLATLIGAGTYVLLSHL